MAAGERSVAAERIDGVVVTGDNAKVTIVARSARPDGEDRQAEAESDREVVEIRRRLAEAEPAAPFEESSQGDRPFSAKSRPPSGGPMTLPARPVHFTGREDELHEVMEWLEANSKQEREPVNGLSIVGMGGIGKTALVLEAAHDARARGWFRGGILYTDLHGYSSGSPLEVETILEQFLHALRLERQDLPPSTDGKLYLWRSLLERLAVERRPLLIVLDNVFSASQIYPLLVDQPHSILLTSRGNLSTLSTYRVELGPLGSDDGLALLEKSLKATGDRRIAREREAAKRIVDLCSGLPLALKIIVALMRDERKRPLSDYVAEFDEVQSRLDVLHYDDVDAQGRQLAVRVALDLSYQHLTEPQARAFRLLTCSPGHSISTEAAAVLLGETGRSTHRLLVGLASMHLLDQIPDSRWSMHDLVCLYANERGELCAADDQRNVAITRLYSHYDQFSAAAVSHLDVERNPSSLFWSLDNAVSWLEVERNNLVSSVLKATAVGQRNIGIKLGLSLITFFDRCRYIDDWITVATTILDFARDQEDHNQEGIALGSLGMGLREAERFDEAVGMHGQQLAIFRQSGDYFNEAIALDNLGLAQRKLRNFPEAIKNHRRSIWIFHELGWHHRAAIPTGNLGGDYWEAGQLNDAMGALRDAAALFCEFYDYRRASLALGNLSGVLTQCGRLSEAIDTGFQAIEIAQDAGDRYYLAIAKNNVGSALARAGFLDQSISYQVASAELFEELGDYKNYVTVQNSLAYTFALAGRFGDSRTAYSQAIVKK